MCTTCTLTVSPSNALCWRGGVHGPRGVCSWGVYLVPRGVYLVLGGLLWGVYLVWGCTWSQGGVCSGGSALGGCTWSQGVCSGGVYLVPGGCLLLCVCSWGMHLVPGGVPGHELPPCGQTHACKHIKLPQTSFAGGNDNQWQSLGDGKYTQVKEQYISVVCLILFISTIHNTSDWLELNQLSVQWLTPC